MSNEMEPERDIEKKLKAYAKERQSRAGARFALDNVARKRLQEAVANQTSGKSAPETMSLWQAFRWHWALMLTVAVVAFLGVAIVILPLGHVQSRGQQYLAKEKLQKIGTAAQVAAWQNHGQLPATLDALTNSIPLNDAESSKQLTYVAGGKNLNNLSKDSMLAYSTEANGGRTVLFADGRVEPVNEKQFSDLTRQNAEQLFAANGVATRKLYNAQVPANVPMPNGSIAPEAPAPPAVAVAQSDAPISALETGIANTDKLPGSIGGQLAQKKSEIIATNFVQLSTLSSASVFKNLAVNKANANVVLNNFSVQQKGNAVRIVDGDGSIYEGNLVAAVLEAKARRDRAGSVAGESSASQADQLNTAVNRNLADALKTAPDFSFRVVGTNQTSKQNVVFTGNLAPFANGLGGASQFAPSGSNRNHFGGGQSQSQISQSQNVLLNFRISGNAVLDNSNNVEINAVAAP